uniref:VEFS-Box domain-containing protein n=1 Tax=Onchocerca volvulus TaxID=6282 RepID=A0A8R1TVC0_ONCVO
MDGERALKFDASALVSKRNVHATQVAFTIFIILHGMKVRGDTLRNDHLNGGGLGAWYVYLLVAECVVIQRATMSPEKGSTGCQVEPRRTETRSTTPADLKSSPSGCKTYASTSPYKTRQQSNGIATEKTRYTPDFAPVRSRRGSAAVVVSPLQAVPSTAAAKKKGRRGRDDNSDDDTASSSSGPVNAKRTRLCYNKNDIKNMEIVDDIVPEIEEIVQQNNMIKDTSHDALTERQPQRKIDSDLEQHFKIETMLDDFFAEAIRLYRYMSLPDTQVGSARPIYRPFLKRNLIYMRRSSQSITVVDVCMPPLCPSTTTAGKTGMKAKLRKHEHIMDILHAIKRRNEILKKNAKTKSSSSAAVSYLVRALKQDEDSRKGNGKDALAKGTRRHGNCSHATSMIKFVDVRNKELPGNRHAIITVYLSSEVDGVFSEIMRLPSATVQMQINTRGEPVAIDLPLSIGCPLHCSGKQRNDYVIIRVTFSGEEFAHILGGKSLRSVPSRQTDKGSKTVVHVTRRISCLSSPDKMRNSEGSITMYGARCISSVAKGETSDGLIYGHGSITLIPDSLLSLNDRWRSEGNLTKKLIDLGKKMHMSPFVRMSIVPDNSGESSSSEDDDETRSCSSFATSASTSYVDHSRQTSEMSAKESTHSLALAETGLQKDDSVVYFGFEEYMKSRFRREMSLEFPKQICYRFITRYNDEPNTSFPESKHLLCSETSSDFVKNELFNSNGSVETAANGIRRHCSPLKEVSPGKILNGRLLSKPLTSSKSSPKSVPSSTIKYRLDVPRRDKPLAAMVDSLASKFEKCSKIVPPKSVAPDDKVTVPELHYEGYPEPDGNGIVTRFVSPANKCFFCLGTFPDMFALLLHMRTSYPRLDIVYRGDARQTAVINNSAPVFIDVFVRKHFDCSYEGPLVRQYTTSRNRVIPQHCIPSDRLTYIVHKAEARAIRKMPKDLSIFFMQADRERRATKGNNAAYFGFRSRHPLMKCTQISTKQTDQEWLREFIIRQIEDFLDLSRVEKDFMSLWSIFLLNLNHKPLGRCHTYRTCRLFLQKHRQDILQNNFQNAWVFHLTALHEKEALDTDEVYDLTMRLKDNYDPSTDVRHVVYATRARLEAAAPNAKREPPAWQKEPVHGPKISILRSSSVARLSSLEPNSDNEDMFKKFMNDSARKERRSSSCSVDEPSRHSTNRRQREPDCSKYLTSPRATQPPKWLSFAE